MLHEYLRDTLELGYNECKSCKNRTQFTCIGCGFCYSCHWKKERLEKVQLEPLLKTNSAFLENYSQASIVKVKQSHQSQPKVIDVYGQETEPICNYHTCHHKFSLHGLSARVCKCNHPQNYTIGISR